MPQNDDVLKAITEAIKQLGGYSDALLKTMNMTEQKMRQNAELTEKMAKSMTEAQKSADTTSKVMEQILSIEEKYAATKEKVAIQMNELAIAQGKSMALAAEEEAKRAVLQTKEYEENLKMQEKWRTEHKAMENSIALWTVLGKKIKEVQQNMAINSPVLAMAATTTTEGLFGSGGIKSATKGITDLFMGEASFGGVGGLIGLMLSGKFKESEFAAVGQQAAQKFEQVGRMPADLASKMGGLARSLSVSFGATTEDVVATASALASFGLSADKSTREIMDLTKETLSLDKRFEVAAGTFAKLGGTIEKDFGIAAKDGIKNLREIAAGAQQAGLNAVTFIQQIMEAASALKMFGATQDGVARQQLNFTNMLQNSGMGRQQAGMYAAQGMGGIAKGISGMQEGMMAYVGQELGMGEGLDALYAMKDPLFAKQTGKTQDVEAIMLKVAEIAKSASPERSGQLKFLESQGFSVQSGQMLLDATKDGVTNQKALKEVQKSMQEDFKSESQKTSEMVRIQKSIRDGVAQIGAGLLGVVVGMLQLIYQSLLLFLQGPIGNAEIKKAIREDMAITLKNVTDAQNAMAGGAKQAGRAFGGAFSYLGFNGMENTDRVMHGAERAEVTRAQVMQYATRTGLSNSDYTRYANLRGDKSKSLDEINEQQALEHKAIKAAAEKISISADTDTPQGRFEVLVKYIEHNEKQNR